jgi:hypothetical protein
MAGSASVSNRLLRKVVAAVRILDANLQTSYSTDYETISVNGNASVLDRPPGRHIVFQPYSVDITFDDNSVLVVEHSLEHISRGGDCLRLDIQHGFGPTNLHQLVGRKIARIDRDPFLLAIAFEDGQALKVLSKPGPLESGHLFRGGDVSVF